MRNIIAVFVTLVAFTATVALVNAQGASADAAFSFDIREAVERLAVILAHGIETLFADSSVYIPYAGAMVLGAIGLALPSVFVFTLFGRMG